MIRNDNGYFAHPLLRDGALEYRIYQDNLAKSASQRNTLIVLPTALGKTVIALLTSLFYIDKGKVLFLAPTRPLVQQHYETFRELLKLSRYDFAVITGFIPPTRREWIYRTAKILFATPQALANDVEAGRVDLRDFSLLIFDEAHRARGDYQYVRIAKAYRLVNPRGRILALTASPGSEKDRIKEVCENLYIEKIEVRDEEDEDVKPYIVPVKVEWKKVSLPDEYKEIRKVLREMLKRRIEWLLTNEFIYDRDPSKKEILDLMERLSDKIEKGEKLGSYYEAIGQASAAMALFMAIELIESQGIDQLHSFIQRIKNEYSRGHRIIVSDEQYPQLMKLIEEAKGMEHPKVNELIDIVDDQLKREPKSRILIFTQYRDTARDLVDRLTALGYKAERFIGQASRYGDPGLRQREQLSILNDFKNGKLNILVATSIAEEGLDVAECNMVVFYEPVPSEIRLIQRKGRTGRKLPGRVVVLATKSSTDTAYLYFSLRKMRLMKKFMEELNRELEAKSKTRKLDEFL